MTLAEQQKAQAALDALEQAYAYYMPEPHPRTAPQTYEEVPLAS